MTGATEGIGRATAFAFGRRGAKVAICARTEDRVRETARALAHEGIEAIGTACDVADEASVDGFAQFVHARFPQVDVLVNNAGVGYMQYVDEMSVADFDQTMAVNVRGVFLVTRAFLPSMKRQGSGCIVNVASLAGRNPIAGGAAYAASKHAVLGFAKSLLLEVRTFGIRVLTVCPGSVVTAFFDKAGMELHDPERKLQSEDVADAITAAVELPARATLSEFDIRPSNP